MKTEVIRKNIVTNQYEHYVEESNYWSPGVTGNNNLKNVITDSDVQIRNSNGVLLSYDGVVYNPVKYILTPLSGGLYIPITLESTGSNSTILE